MNEIILYKYRSWPTILQHFQSLAQARIILPKTAPRPSVPTPNSKMKVIIFATLLAVVVAKPGALVSAPVANPAGTFYTRAPAYDSAVIQSDRLGGNFAYSVSEAHAYAAHTPVVQQVRTPVAVTYNTAPAAAAVSATPVSYTSALPASKYYAVAPATNYYNAYYPYNYGYRFYSG